MRPYIFICLLFSILNTASANYYFSSTLGNDNRTASEAKKPLTPWKTLSKLNAIFNLLIPGDTVFFNRGDVFEGSINVTRSGAEKKPIVFAPFGSGDKPVISGFATLSKWIDKGNKIFECNPPVFLSSVNVLLINGIPQAIGRYPNAGAVNKGYLNFENSTGNVQIKDNQLAALPNWTNAEVVIRKNRWVIDRNLVTLHAGNTINYISDSHYSADVNFGYFFQNHPSTLDKNGEWYYGAKDKKVGIYLNSLPALSVIKISARDTLVFLNGQRNLSFNNISFEGANKNTFEIGNSYHVTIDGCEILFSGANAVNVSKSIDVNIVNSFIFYSNNVALNFNGCNYAHIRGNKIKCTGVFAGMGKGDSGSYEAVMIDGDNNTIDLNEIDSTGYIPITFSGNEVDIRNNFIKDFAFIKDDGGGIYTYNGFDVPKISHGRRIIGNIILNGKGAPAGTTDTSNFSVSGIYMDDKVNNVEIRDNTVGSCGKYGIFIHNANTIVIKKNTLFNNGKQIGLIHDNIAPNDPVKNISLIGNIFFSKDANSPVAEYKTIGDDLQNFGNFDSNYYCRPLDDNTVINLSYKKSGSSFNNAVNLATWKSLYGLDKLSQKTSMALAAYTINQLIGSNKFSNGAFGTGVGGLYAWSAAGNCVAAWNARELDSGALQISFSKITGSTSPASIIAGIGSVGANKNYVLRFSSKGADISRSLQFYLRKSLSDYKDISERKNVAVTVSRTENELLLTPVHGETNASIVVDILEQKKPVFLDNLQLFEASVSKTDVDKMIRFEYNASTVGKVIALDGGYIDISNKKYTGKFTLQPFTSIILIRQPVAVSPSATVPAFTMRGSMHMRKYN